MKLATYRRVGSFKEGDGSDVMAEEKAQQLESGVQIVHAIPGRVRLRVIVEEARSTLDALEKHLRQQSGISEVRKNAETGSLTVAFDAIALPLPQLLQELHQYGVGEPDALPATAKQSDPFATWKSAAYWKKQGKSFLPIAAGLLLARGLGLVGWRALLAYMFAASATRQLFEQLEQLEPETPVLLPVPSPETAAPAVKPPARFALPLPLPLKRKNSGDRPAPSEREQPDANGFSSPQIAYNIVHAIPGRVRFQVPRIAEDPQYARRLQKLTESTIGVTGTRVNAAAGSVVVTYDVSALSPGQMRSRIAELIQVATEAKAPTAPTPPPPDIDPSEGGKMTEAGGADSDTPSDTPTDAPIEAEAPGEEPAPEPKSPAKTPDVKGKSKTKSKTKRAAEEAIEVGAGETAEKVTALEAAALPLDIPATEPVTAIAVAAAAPDIPAEGSIEPVTAIAVAAAAPDIPAEGSIEPVTAIAVATVPVDIPAEETIEPVTVLKAAVLQPEISLPPPANWQAIASKTEPTEPEEPVNLWPCLWQTIRSTLQGLRSGLPPMHALIAGLRDAGAIS